MTGLTDQQLKKFTEILKNRGIIASKPSYIPSRENKGEARLSFAQQRIWLFEQLNPGNTSYLIHTGVKLEGHLNLDALCYSIRELVKRHEILRTTFHIVNGKPMQVLQSNMDIKPEIIISDELDSNNYLHKIDKISIKETNTPFNLESGPLMRVKIIKIDSFTNIMLLTIHHIISDSWSLDIMLKELANIYDVYTNKKVLNLSNNKIQYADYAEWQHTLNWDTQLSYWQKELQNAPHISEIPTDFPRPENQVYDGGLYRFKLSEKLSENIQKYCQQNEITLYMFLLAAFNVLVFRYSDQDDILIGTPVSNRENIDLENMLGMFANTAIIRTRFNKDTTFNELVKQTKGKTLKAFEHGHLPFDKLIEKIAPQRDYRRSPLFQIMFMMQETSVPTLDMNDLKVNILDANYSTSLFDLSLACKLEDHYISGIFEYNKSLFKEETIQRIKQHFETIVGQICIDPDKSIAKLTFLTKEELKMHERTEIEISEQYDVEMITKIFEEQVDLYPNLVAITSGKESLTYTELNIRANRLANFILKSATKHGEEIAIVLGNSIDTLVAMLSVLKAGFKYIPIEDNNPVERISYILNNHKECRIITNREKSILLEPFKNELILIDQEAERINLESTENLMNISTPEVACIIYTSGSTGKPKGVKLSYKGLINIIESFVNSYNVNSKDRILPLSSVASASFIGEIFPLLCSGGSIALIDHNDVLDVHELYKKIREQDITIISTVPSFIKYLNQVQQELPCLRLILSGGEPLYFNDVKNLIGDKTIVNGYGLTETTICSTYYIVSKKDSRYSGPLPIGKPIQNTQVFILDSNQNISPTGCIGEIFISGYGVSMGYIQNVELNEEKFIEHPFNPKEKIFKTGDLGRRLSDGTIVYSGREDLQAKIRGFRVEPSEIESCLQSYPDIQKSLVLIREENEHQKVIYAIIQTEKEESIILQNLRSWLREKLPEYMVPTRFIFVEEFPIGSNGKIDIQNILQKGFLESKNEEKQEASTLLEREITEIWKELLSVEKVGVNQNFFDIGGHSLMMIDLMLRIRNKIHPEIQIVDLFKYPTIALLSDFLANVQKNPNNDLNSIQDRVKRQKATIKKRIEKNKIFNAQRGI